jgi:ABC-type uncharacterized transport system substrate-binding protein
LQKFADDFPPLRAVQTAPLEAHRIFANLRNEVLAKLGFQEGANLVIDRRVGDDMAMPGLAQDLIVSRPDAIIAFGTHAIRAAHKASTTIPIVTFGPDPVTLGLAASVARPGGHDRR